jgi:hypothetical protein
MFGVSEFLIVNGLFDFPPALNYYLYRTGSLAFIELTTGGRRRLNKVFLYNLETSKSTRKTKIY